MHKIAIETDDSHNNGVSMNPYWLTRRAVKRLIILVGLGARLTEYCRLCGKRQPLTWHAPDELWLAVNGSEDGVLCPECFDRRASEMGFRLTWGPTIHSRWTSDGTRIFPSL